MGLKRSAKAIRGRGANIFTQWVGDPDALGSAVAPLRDPARAGGEGGADPHRQPRPPAESQPRRAVRHRAPGPEPRPPAGGPPLHGGHLAAPRHAGHARRRPGAATTSSWPTTTPTRPRWRRTAGPRACAACGCPSWASRWARPRPSWPCIAAAFDVLDKLTPAEKAAAALGIYTDTSALLHGATPLDFKMFEVLTRSEETQDILDELRDYRVPPEWYAYRAAAFRNQEVTGRRPRGPGRLRARRPPRRDRRDRERAAAGRGHVDRDHPRGDDARGGGLGAGGQPPARRGPAAHRPGDRLPAGAGLPRRLRLPARPAAAAPRGGRRLRAPHAGPARGVAPRQRRRAGWPATGPSSPTARSSRASWWRRCGTSRPRSRPRCRACSTWWPAPRPRCPATGRRREREAPRERARPAAGEGAQRRRTRARKRTRALARRRTTVRARGLSARTAPRSRPGRASPSSG